MLHRPWAAGPFVTAMLVGAGLGGAATACLVIASWFGAFGPAAGPVAGGGWTDRSRAWFTHRGFSSTDVDAEGRQSTWTAEGVRMVVPHLIRTEAHRLELDLSAPGRPEGAPLPTLSWAVDGREQGTQIVSAEPMHVVIALAPSRASRAVITLRVTPTFTPGSGDDRRLGVLVRGVSLSPASGRFRPAAAVLWRLFASVSLMVAALVWCGLAGLLRAVVVGGVTVLLVWLVALDHAFLGPFVETLFSIAVVVAILGLGVWGIRAAGASPAVPDWSVAVGLLLAGAVIKMALLSHPQVTIGDGWFQMHRAQMVVGGQYFFTSVTPRPFFEFPYAIALYVTALPFWTLVPQPVDQVWLLRTIIVAADALAGLALYAVARQAWASRPALWVAALWPLAHAPFEALNNANLTNVYGQSLFALGMAGVVWVLLRASAWRLVAVATTGVVAAAFLSHFSTLSVGAPLLVAMTGLVWLGADRGVRGRAMWILLITIAAIAIAYVVYYRHFGPVYAQTLERVLTQAPEAAPVGSSMSASPWVKLHRWATSGSDDYGLPGLPMGAASVLGLWWLWRERRREPWTLVLGGWLAVWVGFTALGILTSVQMRANLAAAPVFVCLGAYGLGRAWDTSAAWRSVVCVAVVAIGVNVARLWLLSVGR